LQDNDKRRVNQKRIQKIGRGAREEARGSQPEKVDQGNAGDNVPDQSGTDEYLTYLESQR